jgi:hypothetical protein
LVYLNGGEYKIPPSRQSALSPLEMFKGVSLPKNPEALRLLGRSGNLHKHLGLSKKWAFNIISQVGNYAQSFDRNVIIKRQS